MNYPQMWFRQKIVWEQHGTLQDADGSGQSHLSPPDPTFPLRVSWGAPLDLEVFPKFSGGSWEEHA